MQGGSTQFPPSRRFVHRTADTARPEVGCTPGRQPRELVQSSSENDIGQPKLSFSEDGCTKCQKPNALQQQRGLNPSGNDGRQAARSGNSVLPNSCHLNGGCALKPAGCAISAPRPKWSVSLLLLSGRFTQESGHASFLTVTSALIGSCFSGYNLPKRGAFSLVQNGWKN